VIIKFINFFSSAALIHLKSVGHMQAAQILEFAARMDLDAAATALTLTCGFGCCRCRISSFQLSAFQLFFSVSSTQIYVFSLCVWAGIVFLTSFIESKLALK